MILHYGYVGMTRLAFSPPSYTEAEVDAVAQCVRSTWTGTGPQTSRFEALFGEYKQIENATALSSCTSALFLALKALGIGPGDEVITTAMTFCSTINIVLHCGAKPVLCDIDPVDRNIDPKQIERLITSRTRVIIPVHYCGYPCDMDSIVDIAKRYQLYIVEDCAHAIEAKFRGKHCGTFGEVGCFSFYATKNIAIGEGGMAVSKNESLIQSIARLRLHGLSKDAWRRFERSTRSQYDVREIGYKMNLTDIQSAIGIVQLSRIEEMSVIRTRLWEQYTSELSGVNVDLPTLPKDKSTVHAKHLYTIGLPSRIDRDEFVWRASQEYGITMGVHYKAIPSFSAYEYLFRGHDSESRYPVAMDWGKRTVSLTLSAGVTDVDASRVAECVKILVRSMG